MPLTPEQAAELGLPPAPASRALTPQQAQELGLPAVPVRTGAGESFVRGGLQGATFRWGDEAAAAIDAALPSFLRNQTSDEAVGRGATYGERYANARDYYRNRNAAAQESNPKTYLGGELAGGTATLLAVPGSGAARAPTLLGRLAPAAKAGATIGGVTGAGMSTEESAAGVAADTAGGALTGALLGPAAEAGLTGVGAGSRWLGGKLRNVARDAARRSTGATQADIARLTRENPGRPNEIGDALLSERIRLRSPETIGRDAKALRGTVGKEIGDLVAKADQGGAAFDVNGFVGRALNDVLVPLDKNLAQRVPGGGGGVNPAAERLMFFLQQVEGRAAANGGRLPVAEAHALRQDLDELLRGVSRSQDPESTVLKSAFNEVRGLLSDEIGATMKRAGLGDAWQTANRRYGLASDVGKLAKKGQDRRLGNNAVFGFTQQVAGMGPGSVIGAISNPDNMLGGAALGAAAGALGARGLQNYGAPMTARATQRLAALLAGPGGRGQVAQLTPEVAALLSILNRERPAVRLAPAGADEERPR